MILKNMKNELTSPNNTANVSSIMNDEFKLSLLILYPEFDKVTGPYLRKDGRKHLCLNNSKLSKGNKNKTKTLSYPKALVEVRDNRRLLNNETVDHIDEDFTNDAIDNLQILSRMENAEKTFKLNEERARKIFTGVCLECNIIFTKTLNHIKHNLKQGKAGPFCSRQCAGKHNQKIQALGCVAKLVETQST